MMDETAATYRASVVKSLFQGIEDETGMRGAADPPANDTPGECIDDKRHIHKALPGRDIGEVGDPEHIRRRRPELAVDAVQWAGCRPVADRRPDRLAADHALQADDPHQPLHRAAGNSASFPLQLPPDLARTVDLEILREHAPDIRLERLIPPGAF